MIEIKVYRREEIPRSLYDKVALLLQDAFSERRAQGINFKCGLYSAEDVERDLAGGGNLLIAKDNEHIIGTVSLIERRKGRYSYASHDNLAVISNYKGKGVASTLFMEVLRLAEKDDLDFITSYTATNAESSVRYHLKMGFLIWSKSFGKGYNSYSFIYPLKSFRILRVAPIRWLFYGVKTSLGYIKKKLQ